MADLPLSSYPMRNLTKLAGVDALGNVGLTPSLGERRKLLANEVFFVRGADGNDNNNGSADNAANAFKTGQGAWDYLAKNIDPAGFAMTIKLGPGTYRGISDAGEVITGGRVFIEGNVANPSTVVINETGAGNDCLLIGGSDVLISGVRMISAGSCLHAAFNGKISVGPGLIFHTAVEYHLFCDNGGMFGTNTTAYTVTGGAQGHFFVHSTGWLGIAGVTITQTGSPVFTVGFAIATQAGFLEAPGLTFVGSCTGPRFVIEQGGNISTGNTGNLTNYFPGSAPGSFVSGFYDNLTPPISNQTIASFTPEIGGYTTKGTPTQTANAVYVKTGNLVWVNISISWTNIVGSSGPLAVWGLPFPTSDTTGLEVVWHDNVNFGAGVIPSTYFVATETKLYLAALSPTGSWGTVPLDTAGSLIIKGTYRTP